MKKFWSKGWDSIRPQEIQDGDTPSRIRRYVLVGLALAVLLGLLGLGSLWSFEPDLPDARAELNSRSAEYADVSGVRTGLALTVAMETLLEKPGGLLSNDLMPPGRWLDNIPSWEFGVIVQSRDLARALRENFSRSQGQTREDPALAIVEPRFNFDHRSWILPSSEGEYREGLEQLKDYLDRLAGNRAGSARFFARADNLEAWLASVESRLGSLSQQLSASVGEAQFDTVLLDQQLLQDQAEQLDKTPWAEIDNVFFEARGSTWALALFLRAVEQDFGAVLDNRNARVTLQQIVRQLEAAQEPLLGPVVLNGRGFGIFANHSLVMASYVARAHAATIELRNLLAEG